MSAGHAPENPEGPDGPLSPADPDRPESPVPLAQVLDWMRGRLIVVGHGLLLFGLALAGLGLLLAYAAVLGVSFTLAVKATNPEAQQQLTFAAAAVVFLVWLTLGPLFLLWLRPLARLTRRLAGQWCGVPIAQPYLPGPWADGGSLGCAAGSGGC